MICIHEGLSEMLVLVSLASLQLQSLTNREVCELVPLSTHYVVCVRGHCYVAITIFAKSTKSYET